MTSHTVEPNTPGAWVVETGRTTSSAIWLAPALHPQIEANGVLAFYETQRVVGGGGRRDAPDPVLAYNAGEWTSLRKNEEAAR